MHAPNATADTRTENEPRTLYFTLSLYADRDNVRRAFPGKIADFIDSRRQIHIQTGYHDSLKLRDAIEPLLNDITDRERESRIEDFFLSSPNGLVPETIEVRVPAKLEWSTEGIRFSAAFDGETRKPMQVRTFWYVHSNGAISYHMSFICRYEHSVRDFYFLSMLQKACAPKEFSREDKSRDIDFLDSNSGILPLNSVEVVADGEHGGATFWNYVRRRFNEHAADLFQHAHVGIETQHDDYFSALISTSPFIEVPGLRMPDARYLFLFDDADFFEAIGREGKETITTNEQCREIAATVGGLVEAAKKDRLGGKVPEVNFSAEFLAKVDTLETGLRYHFLSGFCQNIIDFMNQDASEIRDSLDPIYPATPEQEDEDFFFRFANPRSMTQIIPGSRSLNIGNDYIGTCPYAFLIHVASLHNEFLTRAYERQVSRLKSSVEQKTSMVPAGERKDYAGAARDFYDFRTKTLADYIRFRYENVFRYDTEGDCFTSLEKVRGIKRKTTYLNDIVANLESTTRDLEERQRRNDADMRDRNAARLNLLVLIVGGFSILQVLFQILEFLKPRTPDERVASPRSSVLSDMMTLSDWMYNAGGEALTLVSLGLIALVFFGAMAIAASALLKKIRADRTGIG